MTTPSSSSVRDCGGVEPGVMPPMSAWWPRLPTKNKISRPASSNTGVMTVTSGRCVPPLNGLFSATTSPGFSEAPRSRSTVRTLSPMAPRCTGTCGALATSPPVASKMAQEKSSRSLMLTDSEVFCSTAPVCSATLMNRLLNSSSSTGSGFSLPAGTRSGSGSVRRRIMWSSAVTLAVQPGSTEVVALASRISAGPGSVSPARRLVRSNTAARRSAPWVNSVTVSMGSGLVPASRDGRVVSRTVSPAAVASTEICSATSGRSGVAKPKRARCAAVKARVTVSRSDSGTGSAASVPA